MTLKTAREIAAGLRYSKKIGNGLNPVGYIPGRIRGLLP